MDDASEILAYTKIFLSRCIKQIERLSTAGSETGFPSVLRPEGQFKHHLPKGRAPLRCFKLLITSNKQVNVWRPWLHFSYLFSVTDIQLGGGKVVVL